MHNSDITVDLKRNNLEIKKNNSEPWKVSLIDTGENTMTGGRILKLKNIFLDNYFRENNIEFHL